MLSFWESAIIRFEQGHWLLYSISTKMHHFIVFLFYFMCGSIRLGFSIISLSQKYVLQINTLSLSVWFCKSCIFLPIYSASSTHSSLFQFVSYATCQHDSPNAPILVHAHSAHSNDKRFSCGTANKMNDWLHLPHTHHQWKTSIVDGN